MVPRVKDVGLPKLAAPITFTATSVKPSSGKDHAPRKMPDNASELSITSFGTAEIPTATTPIPRVYVSRDVTEFGLAWNGESALRQRFMSVLEELLGELGFRDHILAEEFTFFGMRPDIAMVLRNGIPVGVVEIKCPNMSDPSKVSERSLAGVSDPFVIGQLYDYMMLLRNNFGVQSVFGIVSNYICTRFAWLSDETSLDSNADVIAKEIPDYSSISNTPSPYSLSALDATARESSVSEYPTFSGSPCLLRVFVSFSAE